MLQRDYLGMYQYSREVAPKLDNLKSFPEFQAKVSKTIERLEEASIEHASLLKVKLDRKDFDEVKCQM